MAYIQTFRGSQNCLKCLLKHVQISSVCGINSYDIFQSNTCESKRNYSVKSTIEAFVRTQTGIFKSISESTPVEYCQNFVVTVHDTIGLPWWATIICTTVLLRSCITFPLAIYQKYIVAKVENLRPEIAGIALELRKEVAVATNMYKWTDKTAKYYYNRSLKKQWTGLIIRENCHPFKATLIFWFQLPLWIFLSVSFRNLVLMLPKMDVNAQLSYIELTVGGFGWIPNLTEVDASLILPVTMGVINLAIIEIQVLSKVKPPSKLNRIATNMFRGVSLLMIPVSASVPACLTLYWTTSSAYGLIQNLILMSPRVKSICKIPKSESQLEKPYDHLLTGIKKRLNTIPGVSKII